MYLSLVQQRVRETEELLFRPPRKRNNQIPRVIYGGDKVSAWNNPLHIDKGGKSKARGMKEIQAQEKSEMIDIARGSIQSNILTL